MYHPVAIRLASLPADFAKNASYSLQPSYAKPDEHGILHMLLVRVLVGDPCIGNSSMERPEQKAEGGSLELHESMVNSKSDPTIFVLSAGSDNQAYAEFWLRAKRK